MTSPPCNQERDFLDAAADRAAGADVGGHVVPLGPALYYVARVEAGQQLVVNASPIDLPATLPLLRLVDGCAGTARLGGVDYVYDPARMGPRSTLTYVNDGPARELLLRHAALTCLAGGQMTMWATRSRARRTAAGSSRSPRSSARASCDAAARTSSSACEKPPRQKPCDGICGIPLNSGYEFEGSFWLAIFPGQH